MIAGAVVAYPLHVEFHGQQHGQGANTSGPRPYASDLLAFVGFSHDSLAGHHTVLKLAQNMSEQSSFFGWPLLLVLLGALVLMARSRVYWSALIVALALAALSLGGRVNVDGRETKVPGPWTLLGDQPLFRQVVPTRVAVAVAPVLAVMLALALDRVLALTARNPFHPLRLLGLGLVVAALVPIARYPSRCATGRRYPPSSPAVPGSGTSTSGTAWSRSPSASVGNLEAHALGGHLPRRVRHPGRLLPGSGRRRSARRPADDEPARPGRGDRRRTEDHRQGDRRRADGPAVLAGRDRGDRAGFADRGGQADGHRPARLRDPSLVDGVWLWDVRGKY